MLPHTLNHPHPNPAAHRRRARSAVALTAAVSVLGAGALVAAPASAAPDGDWTLTSPGGDVVVDVDLEAGVLNLAAGTGEATLVDVADLGLQTGTLDLATGLDVVSSTTRTVTEDYEMVTGKQRVRSATHQELRLELSKAGPPSPS